LSKVAVELPSEPAAQESEDVMQEDKVKWWCIYTTFNNRANRVIFIAKERYTLQEDQIHFIWWRIHPFTPWIPLPQQPHRSFDFEKHKGK
jgi:hypothetical protein